MQPGPAAAPGSSSYTIRLAVSTPGGGAACLATVSNTAQTLGLSCHGEKV